MNKKIITAINFTSAYDNIEDRIRLSINYQDYNNRVDFVITRNFILTFIPILNKYIQTYYQEFLANVNEENNEELETFLKEQSQEKSSSKNGQKNKKQDGNSKHFSMTDQSDLSFLRTEDQLLEKIDLTYNIHTKSTTLVFYSSKTKAQAILDFKSFSGIFKSFKLTIPLFKWGLSKGFLDY